MHPGRVVVTALAPLLLGGAGAGVAAAQSESVFGVGIDGRLSDPAAGGLESAPKVAPLVRLRLGPGWRPDLRLDWFSTDSVVEGGPVRLSVRPVLVGVARSWERGRATFTVSAGAGYAFNRVDEGLASPVRRRLGDAFAAGPAGTAWFDLSGRLGLRVSAGYVFVRPRLTTDGPGGFESRTLKADAFLFKVGVVYGLF